MLGQNIDAWKDPTQTHDRTGKTHPPAYYLDGSSHLTTDSSYDAIAQNYISVHACFCRVPEETRRILATSDFEHLSLTLEILGKCPSYLDAVRGRIQSICQNKEKSRFLDSMGLGPLQRFAFVVNERQNDIDLC